MQVKFKRPCFLAGRLYDANVVSEVPDDATLPTDAEVVDVAPKPPSESKEPKVKPLKL